MLRRFLIWLAQPSQRASHQIIAARARADHYQLAWEAASERLQKSQNRVYNLECELSRRDHPGVPQP